MLMTQFPTTLRPIPRSNIHHRLLKNMHDITTSKYTVKLARTEQEQNAAKSNMNETQMNYGVHKWTSGYNDNVQGCVFPNLKSFFNYLDSEDNFFMNVLGRTMIDKDGNPCYILLGSYPDGDKILNKVSVLIARSRNGRDPNSSENNNEEVDDTVIPPLSIDSKENCEAGAVLRRPRILEYANILTHSDKLVYDTFFLVCKRSHGDSDFIFAHVPAAVFRPGWDFMSLNGEVETCWIKF